MTSFLFRASKIPDVMLTVIYFVVQLCIALVFHITFPHLRYTTFS